MSDERQYDWTDKPWIDRMKRRIEQMEAMGERLRVASGWDGTTDGVNHDEFIRNMRADRTRLAARVEEVTRERDEAAAITRGSIVEYLRNKAKVHISCGYLLISAADDIEGDERISVSLRHKRDSALARLSSLQQQLEAGEREVGRLRGELREYQDAMIEDQVGVAAIRADLDRWKSAGIRLAEQVHRLGDVPGSGEGDCRADQAAGGAGVRCRHENTTGYMWRGLSFLGVTHQWTHAFRQPGEPTHHDKIVCDDCNAWLPLGPSNDTDERVAVEIRAAEIAARVADYETHGTPHVVTIDEDIGWRVGVRDFDRPWALPDQHAGYLARCIAEHTEES